MKPFTEENNYRSPDRKAPWLARILPGFYCYSHMAGVVVRACRQARHQQFGDEEWVQASTGIIRALEATGIHVEILNLDRVRELKTPCVFIGNHMSTLETFVLPCLIQPFRPVTFIVKQSLVEYPMFKYVMISRDPVVVGRINPREDLKVVLEEGTRRLERGISIVVFPQTTRVVDPSLSHFNTIGIKLAVRAGVPVVPVALRTDAWGNGKVIKEFGKIDPSKQVNILFGNPMTVTGNGKKEHEEIITFIKSHLARWFAEP